MTHVQSPASESKGLPQNGDQKCNYEAKPWDIDTECKQVEIIDKIRPAIEKIKDRLDRIAPIIVPEEF